MVLEDITQPLFVVAPGCCLGPGHDPQDLLADQRDRVRRLVIGLSGEESHEADLARWAAILAVTFYADVIHVAAPMDPALDVRLGDGQRGVAKDAILHLSHQHRRFVGTAQDGAGRVPQDTKAVAGLVQWLGGCVLAGLQSGILIDSRA